MTRATAGRPDRQPHSPAQPLVVIVTFISKDRDERYVHHFPSPGPDPDRSAKRPHAGAPSLLPAVIETFPRHLGSARGLVRGGDS
jgi:hypothetical protein